MRGCICGPDLAVIALRITRKGEGEIDGVTTDVKARRLGPKRASTIRKVFALRKTDDVRKYVVRREIKKGDKTFYKSPKIQRLVTEKRLRRKVIEKRDKLVNFKKTKEEKAKYDKVLSKYIKEQKKTHEVAAAAVETKPVVAAPVKAAPVKAAPAKKEEAKKIAAPVKEAPKEQKKTVATKSQKK